MENKKPDALTDARIGLSRVETGTKLFESTLLVATLTTGILPANPRTHRHDHLAKYLTAFIFLLVQLRDFTIFGYNPLLGLGIQLSHVVYPKNFAKDNIC